MIKYDTSAARGLLAETAAQLMPDLDAPVLDAAELLDELTSLQGERGAVIRRIGQLKVNVSVENEVATIEYANLEWKGSNGAFQLRADVRYDPRKKMFVGDQGTDGLTAVARLACDLLKARRGRA
jgi:hypothetical protein